MAPERLRAVLRHLLEDASFVDPLADAVVDAVRIGLSEARRMAKTRRKSKIQLPIRLDRLSENEMQVLLLRGEGCGGAEIAERLGISKKTVESHRSNVIKKLRIKGPSFGRWAFRVAAARLLGEI